MKEQINKLALQAREHADSLLGKGLPDMVWQDEYHQKFAELIVRECLAKCDKYASGGAGSEWDMGSLYSAQAIGDEIREHFGVTE